MELYKNIPWDHDDRAYEIRIYYEDNIINILAFFNNRPANCFRYQIHLSKKVDIKMFLKIEKFDHIIENVKEDIKKERWKLFSG